MPDTSIDSMLREPDLGAFKGLKRGNSLAAPELVSA
jgi:hypothetical protein